MALPDFRTRGHDVVAPDLPCEDLNATASLYDDCAPEDAAWAASRLRRQSFSMWNQPYPWSDGRTSNS